MKLADTAYREQSNCAVGNPLTSLVAGAVSALTLLVAFTLLALGIESFWVTFVVGFGVVLPLAMGTVQSMQRQPNSTGSGTKTESDTALTELKQRYAAGEITDEEFERKVERLLETE